MPAGEEMFKFHGYSGPCPQPPLQPAWLARVHAERDELESRMGRLRNFIENTTDFLKLDYANQNLLHRQLACMGRYRDVLDERIVANTPATQEQST
jgi:hypothetical protein